MVIRRFVYSQREQAQKPEAPQCYISARYKTAGLLQRIPVDLIWQCGGVFMAAVQSSRITAVVRASQPSNRQCEYATLLTFPSVHCRLFFFFLTLQNIYHFE